MGGEVWEHTERPIAPANAFVLTQVATRVYAIPVAHVVETMRPLPIEPIASAPAFVTGLAIIRGAPTPVIDLALLLGNGDHSSAPTRLVLVAMKAGRVAIAVDRVIGVQTVDESLLDDAPDLLREARADLIEKIGSLDAKLLIVLRATRLLPDAVWSTLGLTSS